MAAIATLGSHCALQVLKGARDEGLRSVLVCERSRESLYRRFAFIDEIIPVGSFSEILADGAAAAALEGSGAVLVPHGTLVAQMSQADIESIRAPVFGNRHILEWESDRSMKERLMREAGLRTPPAVAGPGEIRGMTIAKRHGAAGGKGYFVSSSPDEYEKKRARLVADGVIAGDEELYLQEYIPGVLAYLQYFYSPLSGKLEFFGVDSRHESDIDGLARIPADAQMSSSHTPSFNVIANSAMVLRESLLPRVYEMGESFVEASARLVKPGMNGPFCIEGVYDDEARFTAFEFSARIVAGTNIYMGGSPYTALTYDEPMSMGRRIAREVRLAESASRLDDVTT